MHLEKKTIRNVFIGVAACILLYWILHETERVRSAINFVLGIASPFIIGASLAFILNVPMRTIEGHLQKIQKSRLRRGIAVLLTFVLILLILAAVFLLLIPQLTETVQSMIPKLSAFAGRTEKGIQSFIQNNPKLTEWLAGTDLGKTDWSSWVQKVVGWVGTSLSTILGGTFTVIGILAGAIVDVVIGIVFAVYCLFQKETLARQGRKVLYAFLPEKVSDYVIRLLRLSNATFSNFLSGQCIEVCILGILFAVAMAIFRMPFIPLVSVLVAVTAFIPVVGAWVGCVIGAFFILVANPIQAVWFVIMFVVLQQIENNLIYPRVVGTSIGLSGMWVLVAVAVGGELMGVAGMFLMIPIASVLYTLFAEHTNARLTQRNVDPEKLKPAPVVFKRRFDLKKTQSGRLFKRKDSADDAKSK